MIDQSQMLIYRNEVQKNCEMFIDMILNNNSESKCIKNQRSHLSEISLQQSSHDQQSHVYAGDSIFFSNIDEGHHWLEKIICQVKKYSQISQQSFINHLLNGENSIHAQHKQPGSFSDYKQYYKEFQLSHSIPRSNGYIVSMQKMINQNTAFTVRSLQGQIFYISFHIADESKYSILSEFILRSNQQIFMIIFDENMDDENTEVKISEKQFQKLQRKTNFIYLTKRKQPKFDSQSNVIKQQQGIQNQGKYYIAYQSLKKFHKKSQNISWQQQLESIKGNLQNYYNLVVEEQQCFRYVQRYCLGYIYPEQINLLKAAIKINFKKSEYSSKNTFKKFIQQQKSNLRSIRETELKYIRQHMPRKMYFPQICQLCKKINKIKKTKSKCNTCSYLRNKEFPICKDCFEGSSHNRVLSDHKVKSSKKSKQFKEQGTDYSVAINYKSEGGSQNIVHIKKIQQDQDFQEDIPSNQRDEQEFQKINQRTMVCLQSTGQRILTLFRKLRDPDQYYKPRFQNPKNKHQRKREERHKKRFNEQTKAIFKHQFQIFQDELIIAIHGTGFEDHSQQQVLTDDYQVQEVINQEVENQEIEVELTQPINEHAPLVPIQQGKSQYPSMIGIYQTNSNMPTQQNFSNLVGQQPYCSFGYNQNSYAHMAPQVYYTPPPPQPMFFRYQQPSVFPTESNSYGTRSFISPEAKQQGGDENQMTQKEAT